MNRNVIRARLRRLARLSRRQTWRSLALVATDPDLDPVYARMRDWHSRRWLTDPAPWFLPSAIAYIEQHLELGHRVVEWGSGASSLWFAACGATVETVEHDPAWEREISRRLPPPSRVLATRDEVEPYVARAKNLEKADWIVIDGNHRLQCVDRVASMLEEGRGRRPLWVIFDDTHRLHYADALHRLTLRASDSRHFCGSSVELRAHMTSILVFLNDA